MWDKYITIALAAILCVAAGVVGVFWILNWALYKMLRSAADENRSTGEHRKRLLAPDYESFERYFGRSAPPQLQLLYADRELIQRTQIHVKPNLHVSPGEEFIARFLPLDISTFENAATRISRGNVAIAVDDFDNFYYTPITPDTETCSVFLHDHDSNESIVIASSIHEFVRLA